MAYLAGAQIYERLRELVEDATGTVGTVRALSGRFAGDLPPGLNVDEEMRRGTYTAAPAEITINPRAHPQRMTRMCSVQVHLLDAEIRVVRTLAVTEHLNDDLRDSIKALALTDASALTQVLEIPSNLHTTAGAEATGIIGGDYVASDSAYRGRTEGEASAIITIHRFTFTATSAPA